MKIFRDFLIFLAILQVSPIQAACIFDPPPELTWPSYNHPSVAMVRWDRKTATAKIITIDGDTISIKHWSCNYIGIEAKLLIHPSIKVGDISSKLTLLSKIALSNDLADRAIQFIEKTPILDGKLQYEIEGPPNTGEFSLTVEQLNGADLLTLRYYRN